jgi:hypothetical protein
MALPSISAQQRARLAEKLQLIGQIMRQVDSGREAVSADQRTWLLESLYRMSLGQVRAIGVPATYAATADALSRASRMSTKALGDQSDDLVYTPFSPCRYIDTRNVGGKISGTREFDLSVTGTSYGGVGACNPFALLGIGNSKLIGAIALNMTIVDTSTAASPGFATARPAGSANTTALVNWTTSATGFQLGNAAVVSTDQGSNPDDLEIFTSGPVHAIVDFFGAFIMPGATALNCTTVNGTPQPLVNGASDFQDPPACAPGYTQVSFFCSHDDPTFTTYLIRTGNNGANGTCRFRNLSGATVNIAGNSVCCRLPGR